MKTQNISLTLLIAGLIGLGCGGDDNDSTNEVSQSSDAQVETTNTDNSNTTSPSLEGLDQIILGMKDVIKWDLRFEGVLQVSTIGTNGTEPLANINNENFYVYVRREFNEVLDQVNRNVLPVSGGQVAKTMVVEFPQSNPWKNDEALIFTVVREDQNPDDNIQQSFSREYRVYRNRPSIRIGVIPDGDNP